MRLIREWFARQKEKSREQRFKEIAETFQIKEKADTFCITHNGDAIQDFPDYATIKDVVKELRNKRETALKYAKI